MTWPFENDTSAITKKLAKKSLQSEKRRNLMVVIAVALAAFLICFTGIVSTSLTQMQRNQPPRTGTGRWQTGIPWPRRRHLSRDTPRAYSGGFPPPGPGRRCRRSRKAFPAQCPGRPPGTCSPASGAGSGADRQALSGRRQAGTRRTHR